MFVALAVVGLLLFSAWLARAVGMPRFNVISAFAASWSVMIIVSIVFDGLTDPIIGFTWVIILTGWISLVIGALSGWAFGRRTHHPAPPSVIDTRRVYRFHLVFTALFAIYIAIQLVNAMPLIAQAGGWQAILTTGANSYRAASLEQALGQSQDSLSGGLLNSVINYATFIPGTVATYTGAILWKARRRFIALTPIALGGLLGLLTMQRTSIILVFLLFTVGIWTLTASGVTIPPLRAAAPRTARSTTPRKKGRLGAFVATLGLLAIAGVFLQTTTQARTGPSENSTLQSTVGEYIVGGFAGLNSRNVGGPEWAAIPSDVIGQFDPSPGMGGYTFTGLWTVLARLGVPVETTRVNLDYTPVTLFGEPTVTNVVSALGEFYLDFRIVGVIALPFLLGLLGGIFQGRLLGSHRLLLVPATAFVLVFAFWSFFVAWSSDLRQLLVAAFGGLILTWAARPRPIEPEPEDVPDDTKTSLNGAA